MSLSFFGKKYSSCKRESDFFYSYPTTAFFIFGSPKTYLSIIAFSIDDIDRAPRLMDGTSRVSETRFSSRSSSFEIQIVSAIAFPRGTTRFGISVWIIDTQKSPLIIAREADPSRSRALATNPKNDDDDDDVKKQKSGARCVVAPEPWWP